MKCPTCGSERWKRGTAPHVEVVDGRKFKAELAARVCGKCGESIVSIDELDRFAVAVAVALAQAGTHSGEAIRAMRKGIGLSATALAELLDVSMETVSRWEHGDRDAPRPTVAILEAMVLDPPRPEARPPRTGSALSAKGRASPRWSTWIWALSPAGDLARPRTFPRTPPQTHRQRHVVVTTGALTGHSTR